MLYFSGFLVGAVQYRGDKASIPDESPSIHFLPENPSMGTRAGVGYALFYMIG